MAGDDHGSWLILAMIMFLTWSILIYGVRMWAKLRVKTVGADDFTVTLALIFSIIQQGIMYSAVKIGYGKRSEGLSAATLDKVNKYIYASHSFYVIGSGLTRVASAFFIEQISHHGPHARPARILAWVSGTWTLSCLFTVAIRPPYSRPWLAIDGEGIMFTRWLGVEWSGLAVSAAVWLLTIHLIWTLQMQLSRRIIILGVFGFRLLLIPITVMRVHSLVPPLNRDPNYSTIPAAILTTGALQFAIISTSLTSLKPFLTVFRPPVLAYGSQSRTSGNGGDGVTGRSAGPTEPYPKLEMFRRVSRRPEASGESRETIPPPGKALVRNGDGSDEGRPYYGFANKPPRSLASRTADDGASTQTESSGRLLIQKTTEVVVRYEDDGPGSRSLRGQAC